MDGADAAVERSWRIGAKETAVVSPGGVKSSAEDDDSGGHAALLKGRGYGLRVSAGNPCVIEY